MMSSHIFFSSRPRTEMATTCITGCGVEARSVDNMENTHEHVILP